MTAAVVALAVVNLATWAGFRLDKARARRKGARRIRERTLLTLAVIGGSVGALVAMYGHRHRHKVAKTGFAATVWLAFALHVAAAAWLVLAAR